LIGIDAGCLPVILPWVDQGKLPNIGKLISRGCYADLRSVIPDVTPPAWTSLVTGRNPGKHGITCEFFKQSNSIDQKEIVSALDNKSKCIWDYVSGNGKTSIVINVPVTHPARRLKGVLIPGYLAPLDPVCYPVDALDELRRELGSYDIYSQSEIFPINQFSNSPIRVWGTACGWK
jgi:predicted AlkP superfamily phosphohydrolase/phosphomutase